jgi:hypothetical protein
MKHDDHDPLLRALRALPRAEVTQDLAADVHRRARLALAQPDDREPASRAGWWLRVLTPALLAAVAAGYFSWSVLFVLAPLL